MTDGPKTDRLLTFLVTTTVCSLFHADQLEKLQNNFEQVVCNFVKLTHVTELGTKELQAQSLFYQLMGKQRYDCEERFW